MGYEGQIQRVVDYIGTHLNDELTIEELSAVAAFSKYHFHRLFTAYTGISLNQYIRWLRLKRAAHQLIVHSDMPIIEIAMNAGFDSHEAFTRVFKQLCGDTPSTFRLKADWSTWDEPPYSVQINNEKEIMNVTIKNIAARRLAVIEHRADPKKIGESVKLLVDWAKAQTTDIKPKPGETFAYAYDDPDTTEPNEFRLDLAISVPEHVKITGIIKERQLPSGRYATAIHKGSRNNISETVYGLYRDWLPESGEDLDDLPCIFCYHNFDHEVAETELLTECLLLLK